MTGVRAKLIRLLLLMSALISLPTALVVGTSKVHTTEQQLQRAQLQIRETILEKGRVLTRSHALALQGLTLDNAFTGMQALVERGVDENSDVLYGVYVAADGATLAFARQGHTRGAKPAPKHAWEQVGLTRDGFLVKEAQEREAEVFSNPVLEIAVPVLDEDEGRPALGTIRYGFSLARVTQAISQVRAEAEADMRTALLYLALLVVVATGLGLFVGSRQAARITAPIRKLTGAAAQLAAGDRNVRVDITSGDEVEGLGNSFNQMVKDLDASYRELELLNRGLEERVRERTAALARMNQEMRMVLDNVDEGLIMLASDGRIVGEPSKAAVDWFGAAGSGMNLPDYVGSSSVEFAENFEMGWQQLSDGWLPLEVALAQLPARMVGARTYDVRYIPLQTEARLDGLLVIVTDVTDALERQREEAIQRDLLNAFRHFMRDREGFAAFSREATALVERIVTSPPGDGSLARQVHTLKGNAALMGLQSIAGICHELEDRLADNGETDRATLSMLRERWTALSGQLDGVRGPGGDPILVDRAEHAAVVVELGRVGVKSRTLHQIDSWKLRPVSKDFSSLGEHAAALAQRLGKGQLEVNIDDGGLRLASETWGGFLSELAHVVRNAVDHGIETPTERARLGKSPRPQMSFRSAVVETDLVFEIEDDGRGIDIELLKRRALVLGASGNASLLELVCREGVSTRDDVTDLSGRGVGMAAVKVAAERLGGSLSFMTKPHVGTTWTFAFPLARITSTYWAPTAQPLERATA